MIVKHAKEQMYYRIQCVNKLVMMDFIKVQESVNNVMFIAQHVQIKDNGV